MGTQTIWWLIDILGGQAGAICKWIDANRAAICSLLSAFGSSPHAYFSVYALTRDVLHLYSGRSKPLQLSMCTTKLQFKTNTQCVTVHRTVIFRCLNIWSIWPLSVESPHSETDVLLKGKPCRYECHDGERTTQHIFITFHGATLSQCSFYLQYAERCLIYRNGWHRQ